jgi:ABC-type transporter Mla subunit MlaD
MTNQTEPQLSTKAKEILQRNAELRQKDNKFIKLQSGEKKILQFFPEKIEQVEAEFNGKKSMRFRYTVIEGSGNQEKYLEVGKRTSEEIDSFLMEGASKLKIQRFGSGMDTRYHVIPA